MSTNFANSADTQQNNFQPSWMRSTFNGGVSSPRQFASQENEEGLIMSAPILVNNRYGREDLLALVHLTNPPEGLRKCPLFVEKQVPVVLTNFTEIEERLSHNINSSKAMYKSAHLERLNSSGDNVPSGASGAPRGGGWTPVKQTRPERGTNGVSGSGTTSSVRGRGFANIRAQRMSSDTVPSEDAPPVSMYGQRYVTRGRGAASVARGGSTSAAAFNSRAQGLYDPKDPKDRPRPREATEAPENNGTDWQATPTRNASAWNRSENNGQSGVVREHSQTSTGGGNSWKQDTEISTSTAPEWAESDEVTDDLNGPGSFDEKGRFHHLKGSEPTSAVAAEPWNATQQNFLNRMHSDDDSETHHRVSPDSLAYAHLSEIRQKQSVAPPPPTLPRKVKTPPPVTFTYVDPSNQERGPFPESQMIGWFQAGYFVDDLKVKRGTDEHYKTLGELKKLNGATTPFDFKEELPPPAPEPLNFFAQPTFPPIFGSSAGLWSSPSQVYAPPTAMYDTMNEIKRIEEEKRRFQERMIQKEREMREAIEKQAEEQARMILEREAALKAKEAEVARIVEKERKRIEMEQMEIMKRQQLLQEEEASRKALLKKMEDDARKEKELRDMQVEFQKEQRRRAEAEEKRKQKEIEDAKKKAETEKRRAEEAAEQHKRQLEKKAVEDAAKIKAHEERRRQQEEEALAAALERQFIEKTDSSEWETVSTSPSKKTTAAPKVAPWSASAGGVREKTLKEIQEEEERQMRAELEELTKIKKQHQKQNSNANLMSGTWSNASQKLSWNQPAKSVAKSSAPAWGGAGTIDVQPAAPSPFWDGPSLQAANRPTVAPQPKKPAAAPQPKKQVAVSKPTPAAIKSNAAKTAVKKQDDQFGQWVVQKLKQINPAVEADVLASFLQTVQNPNEVEDYVEGYLGSTKVAKEFVKEFLQKRSDIKRSNKTDKDDLSCASVTMAAGTGAGAKKKKNKGERLIDTSCLGFSAAADPNRFNQGEIETVPLAPGQRR